MILRIVGIMALGMSLAVSAHAGRGIDRATGQAIWDAAVNGKTTTIGGGNGSMRVIKPTTTGTPVRGSGGGVSVTDAMPVPVGGAQVPVSATTNVSKTDIAGAVVGCATGGVVGCALSAIPLAAAWMSLSGTRVNPQSGALEQMPPASDAFCYSGPCYQWKPTAPETASLYRDPAAACQAYLSYINVGANPPWVFAGIQTSSPNGGRNCLSTRQGYGNYSNPLQAYAATPLSPTWHSATPQEVKDALYKNDPPPPIIDELSRYGNIIWPGPASVTGPSEIKGPKTTTIGTEGNKSTTKVTETKTPLSYEGSTVKQGTPVTTTTTTTTTTNPDGSTSTQTGTETTTTTEGDTPGEAAPGEEAAPSDTALPPVPDLYTRKYPNGMEGIWSEYKDQLKGTSLVSLVGKLMPNVGDGGSCPSWMLNLDMAQWATFGTHDVAPPCWIWDVAKAILILSALLLARSLIFGG